MQQALGNTNSGAQIVRKHAAHLTKKYPTLTRLKGHSENTEFLTNVDLKQIAELVSEFRPPTQRLLNDLS